MTTLYHYIAGQSMERLAALSDGIFAVATKLLVLDLRVPVREALHLQQLLWASGAVQSEQVLWDGLVGLAPRLLTYFKSFLRLGSWQGRSSTRSSLSSVCGLTVMDYRLARRLRDAQ